jgi:hypothetical protein
VDAPFDEDISTPHEKALGEMSWGDEKENQISGGRVRLAVGWDWISDECMSYEKCCSTDASR